MIQLSYSWSRGSQSQLSWLKIIRSSLKSLSPTLFKEIQSLRKQVHIKVNLKEILGIVAFQR